MLEQDPSNINPNTKFMRLGFDSTMSVELAVAVEERYGLRIDLDTLAEYPTISQLSAFLAKSSG